MQIKSVFVFMINMLIIMIMPTQSSFALDNKSHSHKLYFDIHKTNYILPFSYTSPINHGKEIRRKSNFEVLFQISIKIHIISKLLNDRDAFFIAYTQRSFWQAYKKSPFMRENIYAPEIFYTAAINKALLGTTQLDTINIGFIHESNGKGGLSERTWNRLYFELLIRNGNFIFSIMPWYILPEDSVKVHNPNISNYLGHFRLKLLYESDYFNLSLKTYNFEAGIDNISVEATIEKPISKSMNVFIRYFNGFGQSLLNYHKRVQSINMGFSFSN